MLENAAIYVKDVRSPGRKYPFWEYTIQCRHGGCTWNLNGRSIRKLENKFVDHDIDWHGDGLSFPKRRM